MPHHHLNRAQVDAQFQQMCGVGMAKAVYGQVLVDAAADASCFDRCLHTAPIHRRGRDAG